MFSRHEDKLKACQTLYGGNSISYHFGAATSALMDSDKCARALGTERTYMNSISEQYAALVQDLRNPWRPIDTAPKDGTEVMVYAPLDGVVSSNYRFGAWQKLTTVMGGDDNNDPTHWAPMLYGAPVEGE